MRTLQWSPMTNRSELLPSPVRCRSHLISPPTTWTLNKRRPAPQNTPKFPCDTWPLHMLVHLPAVPFLLFLPANIFFLSPERQAHGCLPCTVLASVQPSFPGLQVICPNLRAPEEQSLSAPHLCTPSPAPRRWSRNCLGRRDLIQINMATLASPWRLYQLPLPAQCPHLLTL